MRKIVLLCLTLILVAGCSQGTVLQNQDLAASIVTAMREEGVQEIDLSALTGFEWDEAVILTPYMTDEKIQERLGTDFNGPGSIGYRDDINVIVFLNDGEAVQYTEVSRQYGDLVSVDGKNLTPSAAILQVKK